MASAFASPIKRWVAIDVTNYQAWGRRFASCLVNSSVLHFQSNTNCQLIAGKRVEAESALAALAATVTDTAPHAEAITQPPPAAAAAVSKPTAGADAEDTAAAAASKVRWNSNHAPVDGADSTLCC